MGVLIIHKSIVDGLLIDLPVKPAGSTAQKFFFFFTVLLTLSTG